MRYQSFYPFERQQSAPHPLGQPGFGFHPFHGPAQVPRQPFQAAAMNNPFPGASKVHLLRTGTLKDGWIYANRQSLSKYSPAVRTGRSTICADDAKSTCHVEII